MPDPSLERTMGKPTKNEAASAAITSRCNRGAHDQIRTGDLDLTKIALYRLSYVGVAVDRISAPVTRASGRPTWVVGAGFEPANRFREPILQTGAINHSATPPRWSRRRDSNPQPAVYKTAALPVELRRRDQSPRLSFANRRPPSGVPTASVCIDRLWNIPRAS